MREQIELKIKGFREGENAFLAGLAQQIKDDFLVSLPIDESTDWYTLLDLSDIEKEEQQIVRLIELLIVQNVIEKSKWDANIRTECAAPGRCISILVKKAGLDLGLSEITKTLGNEEVIKEACEKILPKLALSYFQKNPVLLSDEDLERQRILLQGKIDPVFIGTIPKEIGDWNLLLTESASLRAEVDRLMTLLIIQQVIEQSKWDANIRTEYTALRPSIYTIILRAGRDLGLSKITKILGNEKVISEECNNRLPTLASSYFQKNPVLLSDEDLERQRILLQGKIDPVFIGTIPNAIGDWNLLLTECTSLRAEIDRLMRLLIVQNVIKQSRLDADIRVQFTAPKPSLYGAIKKAGRDLGLSEITKTLGNEKVIDKECEKILPCLAESYFAERNVSLADALGAVVEPVVNMSEPVDDDLSVITVEERQLSNENMSKQFSDALNPQFGPFNPGGFELLLLDLADGDVNVSLPMVSSLMMLAFGWDNMEAMRYLIERQPPADVNTKMHGFFGGGESLLTRVINKGNTDLARVLVKHGARFDESAVKALLLSGNVEMARLVLKNNPSLVPKADLNHLLISMVFNRAKPEMIQLLLELGASPSAEMRSEDVEEEMIETAMGTAIMNRDYDTLKQLVDANGDVERAKTGLILMKEYFKKDFIKTVEDELRCAEDEYERSAMLEEMRESLGEVEQIMFDFDRGIEMLNDGVYDRVEDISETGQPWASLQKR